MPNVASSIIASLVKSYYDFAVGSGAKFGIGLNMGTADVVTRTDCSGSGNPDCVFASYTPSTSTGTDTATVTATFSARFTPSADYTLTRVSLVAYIPGQPWVYAIDLIDADGLSVALTGGALYSIELKEDITYNTKV